MPQETALLYSAVLQLSLLCFHGRQQGAVSWGVQGSQADVGLLYPHQCSGSASSQPMPSSRSSKQCQVNVIVL